jgi:probable lipoprotein NlpC
VKRIFMIKYRPGTCLLHLLLVYLPGFLSAEVPVGNLVPAEARERLVFAAEQYLGVPYRYGGMDSLGLDCSGLVYLSFRDVLSVAVPRTAWEIELWAEKIPESELQKGDLVFFDTGGNIEDEVPGRASHVGIYAGEGRFIHAASRGPRTGVIYSFLEELSWRRAFIGAGRVLPPVSEAGGKGPPIPPAFTIEGEERPPGNKDGGDLSENRAGKLPLCFSVGMGASWNPFIAGSPPFRGVAVQFQLAYVPNLFSFGMEFRPEWDNALGIFRLPLTFSVGIGDIVRIFAGPAVTLGDPVIRTPDGDRRYIDKFPWIGIAGLTLTPLVFRTAKGKLALYGEAAWRTYFRESGLGSNSALDTGAALHISTGLRYVWEL